MAPRPSDAILVRSVAEGLSPLASLLLEGARAAAGLDWCGALLPGMEYQRVAPVTIAEALERIPGVPERYTNGKSGGAGQRLRSAFREIVGAGLAEMTTTDRGALALNVRAEALTARRGSDLVMAKLPHDLEPMRGRSWALRLLVLGSDHRSWVSRRKLARRLEVAPSTVQRIRDAARAAEPDAESTNQVARNCAQQVARNCAQFEPQVARNCAHASGSVQAHQAHGDRDALEAPEQHGPPNGVAELRSDAPRATKFEIVRDPEPEAVAEPVTVSTAEPDREAFEGRADRNDTAEPEPVAGTTEPTPAAEPEPRPPQPTPPELSRRVKELEQQAKYAPGTEAIRERLRAMAEELDSIERSHGAAEAWHLALTAAGVHLHPVFRSNRRRLAFTAAAQLGPPLGCLGALELLDSRFPEEIRNVGALLAKALSHRPESLHAEAKAKGHQFLDEASKIRLEPTEAEAATIARTSATTATVAAALAVDHRTGLERLDDAMRVLLSGSPADGLDLLADLEMLTKTADQMNRRDALHRAIATTLRAAAQALKEQTADRPAVALRLVKLGRERIAEFVGPAAADQLLNLAA